VPKKCNCHKYGEKWQKCAINYKITKNKKKDGLRLHKSDKKSIKLTKNSSKATAPLKKK
jgi:hypothetical protein